MRDIRFRAYEGGKMYYQVQAGGFPNTAPSIYVEKDGVCEWVNSTGENPVMQFTGLLDKNDKEIYEGDVIKATDDDNKIDTWEIKFDEGCFSAFRKRYYHLDLHYWIASQIEIIGNIYENGDLLK